MNTFSKVKRIIIETLGCAEDRITISANLFDDLGADSMEIIEIAVGIEEEFGLELSNEDAEELKTINDVIQYVENHQ